MNIIIDAAIPSLPSQAESILAGGNFYQHLLSCLGYSKDNLPAGDLLRRYFKLQGKWLVATPIHWQATHNDAMIISCGAQLQLTPEQSKQWFEAFASFVADDHMSACYCDETTWLLQYDGKPAIQSKPVHNLIHQSLMPELQLLDDTNYWQRFITESQMYFSAHELNKQRPGLPINGVWLWGAGTLKSLESMPVFCSTERLSQLGDIVSSQVNLYQPTDVPEKGSLLLFDAMTPELQEHLEHQLRKRSVHWYWDNTAYKLAPKRWLSRWR